jgi:hypothetical protein
MGGVKVLCTPLRARGSLSRRPPPPSPVGDCVTIKSWHEIKPIPWRSANWTGDRGAAEGALERNLLVNKIIRLFTMQTSLSTIRMVAHNLKITAILKLTKLALCPLSPLRYSLSRERGRESFQSLLRQKARIISLKMTEAVTEEIWVGS